MPDEKAPTTQPARAAVAIFGPDGKLQEANSYFWELTGYRPEDLGALALLDLVPPQELQRRPLRTRQIENGRPLFSLRPLLRRDGATRLVLARTQKMPGGRAQIVAWAVESGSPALLEEDGWARLVGGLAHHLNGALTLIQGYTALLRERHPDATELDHVQEGARRIEALAWQLQASHQLQLLQPQHLDLARVLEEFCRQRGLPYHGAGPAPVFADPVGLRRALQNLVALGRPRVVLQERLGPEFACAEIVHETLPEPVPDLGRLFERGLDPDRTFATLGLSAAQGLVRQSGGDLLVERQREGLAFLLCLPREEATPERTRRAPRASGAVLLVEDDPAIRVLEHRILQSAGYTVRAAAAGQEALGHLREGPDEFGLLLTDVLMPGMTGPQVAAEVRRLRPRLPVLYVSGHPADLVRPGEREAFLSKPFLPTELLQAVDALLDGT